MSSTDRLDEKFKWQLLDNPHGEGRCWLLLANGEPAGTAALGARRIQAGCMSRRVGVACDLAVDREHRLLHPAVLLQREVVSSVHDGIELVYGLPNSNGAAPIRRIGYRSAGEVHRYAKALRISPYLERYSVLRGIVPLLARSLDGWYAFAMRSREIVSREYSVQIARTFDGRFDEFWARRKSDYPVATVRDSSYLRWRYSVCPIRQYTTVMLTSRDRSRIAGYVVYYVDAGRMMIADLLCDKAERDGCALVAAAVGEGYRISADSISVHAAVPPPVLGALERNGFRRRTESALDHAGRGRSGTHRRNTEMGRVLLVYAESATDPALSNAWYFTPGDEPYN